LGNPVLIGRSVSLFCIPEVWAIACWSVLMSGQALI